MFYAVGPMGRPRVRWNIVDDMDWIAHRCGISKDVRRPTDIEESSVSHLYHLREEIRHRRREIDADDVSKRTEKHVARQGRADDRGMKVTYDEMGVVSCS